MSNKFVEKIKIRRINLSKKLNFVEKICRKIRHKYSSQNFNIRRKTSSKNFVEKLRRKTVRQETHMPRPVEPYCAEQRKRNLVILKIFQPIPAQLGNLALLLAQS